MGVIIDSGISGSVLIRHTVCTDYYRVLHVFAVKSYSSNLRIYHYYSSDAGANWSSELVTGSLNYDCDGISVATDSSANIHLSFQANGCLYYMVKTYGGAWSSPLKIGSETSVEGTDIAIDSGDYPHIAYNTFSNYLYIIDKTSGSWANQQTITTQCAYQVHNNFCIVILSNGKIYATYHKSTDTSSKGKLYSGGSWGSEESIDTFQYEGGNLAVDTNGDINWTAGTHYNKWTAGTWGSNVQYAGDNNRACPNLSVDKRGYIYVNGVNNSTNKTFSCIKTSSWQSPTQITSQSSQAVVGCRSTYFPKVGSAYVNLPATGGWWVYPGISGSIYYGDSGDLTWDSMVTYTTTNNTITAKAKLLISTAKTITGKGFVFSTAVAKTITGKATITFTTATKTITGKSKVTAIVGKTISAVSKLLITTPKTISAKGMVTASTTKTTTGKAAIVEYGTTLKTIVAKADIKANTIKTITGIAKLYITTTKTITGLSRVTISTAKTLIGKSRVTISTLQTTTGKSRITIVTGKLITGISRLTSSGTRMIMGMARVTVTATKTIVGHSRIQLITAKTLGGLSRVTASALRHNYSKARVTATTVITGQMKGRIQITSGSTLNGKSSLVYPYKEELTGHSRITATNSQVMHAVAKIRSAYGLYYTNHQLFIQADPLANSQGQNFDKV